MIVSRSREPVVYASDVRAKRPNGFRRDSDVNTRMETYFTFTAAAEARQANESNAIPPSPRSPQARSRDVARSLRVPYRIVRTDALEFRGVMRNI